jgi:hypothetical protein
MTDFPDLSPAGVDRRTFLMRSAVIGAAAVISRRPIREAGLAVSVTRC